MYRFIPALLIGLLLTGCPAPQAESVTLEVPRGYVDRLWFQADGVKAGFGPFVGYYFKPASPDNLKELHFRCYNERQFYTRDLPANALLYEGTAILQSLPTEGKIPAGDERIRPVFFADAPESWRQSRPDPKDEYLHFHSGYSEAGPVRAGYWLRHIAAAHFTYDMGGRVDETSVLYHHVKPGVDKGFAPILEFDSGPAKR